MKVYLPYELLCPSIGRLVGRTKTRMLHCSSSCLFVNKVLVKKSIIGWLPHLKIFRYSCLILPMSKNCHLRKGRQLSNNTTSILAVFLNDFFNICKSNAFSLKAISLIQSNAFNLKVFKVVVLQHF